MAIVLKKRRLIFPSLKQRDMTECGTTCLAMIFKYYGLSNAQGVLREMAGVSSEGTSLFQLKKTAEEFNFTARGLRGNYSSLEETELPCIAHYEGNHFVVVRKVNYSHVWLVDPGYGKIKMTRKDFMSRWNGIFLTVVPNNDSVLKIKDSLIKKIETRKKRLDDVVRKFYIEPVLKYKDKLINIMLFTFLLQLLNLGLPFASAYIFDNLTNTNNFELLYIILFGFIGIFLAQTIFSYIRNIQMSYTKTMIEKNFIASWFDHLIHLFQKYFDMYKREDFINRFNQNLQIRKIFTAAVLQRVVDLLFIVVYVIALFFISPVLAVYVLIFVVVFAIITIIATPYLTNMEDIIFHESLKPMGSFLDALLGMQTVKLFGLEKRMYDKWHDKYEDSLRRVQEAEMFAIKIETLITVVYQLSHLGIFWIGAYLVISQEITIGSFIAFTTLFGLVSTPILAIIGLWQMFTALSVTFNKLNDVFVQHREDEFHNQHNKIPMVWDLEVKDLHFSYSENNPKPILKNMNFSVPFGKQAAIVGRNGSGKTTIVKLITKLYSHYKGKINIGGHELRDIHHETLRKKIAMVPQDIYIFDGTIRENLLYAKPDATQEEMDEAVRLACFDEFINNNYLGYEYRVGETGSKLSGGQRLRLAFCRLFLSDPEIIILDEATSVLDVESEHKIMKNLKTRFPGKTIISIAHRLSTVKNVDVVIVLDQGSVAELGNHDELIELKGIYYQFMKTYLDF